MKIRVEFIKAKGKTYIPLIEIRKSGIPARFIIHNHLTGKKVKACGYVTAKNKALDMMYEN